MANTFAPYGFKWIGSLSGRDFTGSLQPRLIAYNDTTAIYTGDPVTSLSTGYITRSTAGTTTIAGIFYGCEYLSQALGYTVNSPYWPGSDAASTTTITALICNDPTAIFQVQAGGSTTAVGIANIMENINFAIGTPDTSAKISGAYADQTTLSPSTTTRPFRVIGLVTTPPGVNGTDITTGYNNILVTFNNQDFKTTTGV